MTETKSSPSKAGITIGATFAVVIGALVIVSAPTAIDCLNSGERFGICVREKLIDAGLVPADEAPVEALPVEQMPAEAAPAEEAPAGEAPAEETLEEDQAPAEPVELIAEPEGDQAQQAGESVPAAEAENPELGVRAEPDGSVVIVGSAAPGERVEVFANDTLLGETRTEPNGDWVFLPDEPLPPGGFEITAIYPETGETAEQSVVVVINEDLTSEPLVVASTPGQASEVLQGIEQPADMEPSAPEEATEVAALEEPAAEEMAAKDMAAEEAPQPEVTETAAADEQATPAIEVTAPSIAGVEIEGNKNFLAGTGEEGATIRLYVDNAHVGDAVVSDGHWLLEIEGALKPGTQRIRADQLIAGLAGVSGRAEVDFVFAMPEEASEESVEVAGGEQPAAAPEEEEMQTAMAEPEIAEPVAEEAPAPAAEAEEAMPAAEPAPAEAEQTVEIAQPEETAEGVTQEAMPEAEAPAEEAMPAEVVTEQPEPAETAPESEVSELAQVETEEEAAETALAAAEETAADEMVVSDMPAQEAEPEMVEPTATGEAADMSAEAAAEAASEEAAMPEAEPQAMPAETETAPEPAPDSEVPQLVAVPVGDPRDQRYASGTAIIRRGDNLWTIARRVYGHGIRYTIIYEANTDQIRDPDLIYPGQVFDLPEDAAASK